MSLSKILKEFDEKFDYKTYNGTGWAVLIDKNDEEKRPASNKDMKDFIASAIKEAYHVGRLEVLEELVEEQKRFTQGFAYEPPINKSNFLNS